ESNLTKHQVSFEQAASCFRNGEGIMVADLAHCKYEERWAYVGLYEGRLPSISIAYAEDESARLVHRIISAFSVSGRKILNHLRRLQRQHGNGQRAASSSEVM